MIRKQAKPVYLNDKQMAFMRARQKDRTLIWGRGTGKSTCIALINYERLRVMPRGKVFLSSSTYGQILTKTLPAIQNIWELLGLNEDHHYVIGKKPLKNWLKPYSPPKRYDNVITFWNGFTIEFLSMDRADVARGGSYDGGDIDEAALVPKEHLDKVLLPSIRGNLSRFNHHLHQTVTKYSSQPWKSKGRYLLDYQEKAKQHPEMYYYSQANAYDNMIVLGDHWVERMRTELTAQVFKVEILNEPLQRVPDGFYAKFNENHHTYAPEYVYTAGARGIDVAGTKDVNPDQVIDVSFDFGGTFSCATIWQEQAGVERMVNAMHVKDDKKIDDLVDRFCLAYQGHGYKRVRVWGEPRGHDKNPVSITIYDQVKRRFERNGWGVSVMAPSGYRTPGHEQRHYFIDDILSEQYDYLPKVRVNENTCKDVIFAILMTEIDQEFKKVKDKERDPNYPQEHATHYTDTVDYYLMQKHYEPALGSVGDDDDPVRF